MQLNPILSTLEDLIGFLLEPLGLRWLALYIAFIPFLIIIYILYLISIRSVRVSLRKAGVPREASTGIIFGIRLIFLGVFAFLLLTSFEASLGAALTLSTLLGTAIGLAFSRALSNIVSGIYLFAARPFRVGDYVNVGGTEGLVVEITLNYTRLLQSDFTRTYVPNNRVIESQLTNYRIRLDDYVRERGIVNNTDRSQTRKRDIAIGALRDLTKGEEVHRYSFEISVHKDYPLDQVHKAFSSICEKWSERFLLPPEFLFSQNTNVAIIYRFAYLVRNPQDILEFGSDFQAEIAESLVKLNQ